MHLRLVAAPVAALIFLGCAGSNGIGDGGGGPGNGDGDALTTTTTKTELGANNTSASSLFVDRYAPATRFHGSSSPLSNGDAVPGSTSASSLAVGNVSKVSVHSLVSIPVYVETQSWFCTEGRSPLGTLASNDQCGGHADIGYATNYTARAKQQVADMRARGLDGMIVDWNGQSAGLGVVDAPTTDVAAAPAVTRAAAEARPPLAPAHARPPA